MDGYTQFGAGIGSTAGLLAVGRNLDMTLATDQAIAFAIAVPSRYLIRRVVARLVSGAFGVACAGGLYPAAAKAGVAFVAAAQSWAALTGAGTAVDAVVVAPVAVVTSSTLFLSLTTGNTGALVADVYIFGDPLV